MARSSIKLCNEQYSHKNDYSRDFIIPADPFVASFIGESNFLSVVNAENSNNTWNIKLAGGQVIKVNTSENTQPTKAMIRPESVELITDEADLSPEHYNHLNGIVSYVNYTGVSYIIGIKIEGYNKEFLVRLQNVSEDISYAEGDLVKVRWSIKETLAF